MRRRSPWLYPVLIAGSTLLASACGDDPVPGPGTLTASLVSPAGDEGAAVLLLLGDGVESVSAFGDTEVHARISAAESQTRVVLINELGGTLTFELEVANVLEPPTWVVEEVAGPDDELRPDVGGYRVEFTR